MFRAARTKRAQREQIANTASLPAPVGGWNARDAVSNMPPEDAVQLENWFPRPTDVLLRPGYVNWATGLPASPVESLMEYNSATTRTLFAACGTAFYNVTAEGAVGAAVQSGLTNARWQSVNVTTAGGSYLYAVNGLDKPRLWNGATWVAVDAASTPEITGITTTTLAHVALFKNRLWFTQAGTLKVWYLPTNAIGGAANAIDLASIARRGGYLMGMWSWTIDAGFGVDDLAVFITSEGEVIVYRGTDPSSATTWALVGVWQLGAPLGRRCAMKYAGDLLIACEDGLVPLSGALQSSRTNPRVALSDKIQLAFSEAATLYGDRFGWTIADYPRQNMILVNVPTGDNLQQQYVMNTITKAWAKFTGWPASCWETSNEELYFGGVGVVCKAMTGFSDNGNIITGRAQQSYNYFGRRGQNKRFTMARPIIQANAVPSVQMGLAIDFDDAQPVATLSTPAPPTSTWDASLWDSGTWGGGLSVYRQWQSVVGVGYAAGPYLIGSSLGTELRWQSTDIVMELGGVV
jgi:hypothetical protein